LTIAYGVRYNTKQRQQQLNYRFLIFLHNIEGDHCGMVASQCKEPDTNQGPAIVRTPNGLGILEWEKGLREYAKQSERLSQQRR
jgi:hypothetical protein